MKNTVSSSFSTGFSKLKERGTKRILNQLAHLSSEIHTLGGEEEKNDDRAQLGLHELIFSSQTLSNH